MIVTNIAGVLCIAVDMASLAVQVRWAAVVEQEGVDAQIGWRPLLSCVAILALQPKETSVDLWLSMALDALFWDTLVNFILMAGLAFDVRMAAVQDKDRRMVKVLHAVNPIVAVQAGGTKLALVLTHKGLPLRTLRMADDTRLHIEVADIIAVAGGAGDSLALVIFRMAV